MSSIARRLALPFLGFVVAGSLGIVSWLVVEERNQSDQAFAGMAAANAEFARQQNLPLTPRTAASLSDVLGVKAAFAESVANGSLNFVASEQLPPALPALLAEAHRTPKQVLRSGGYEILAYPVQDASLVLYRPEHAASLFALPRTYLVLGAFWFLSFGLALALARGIVRPLRNLAAKMPAIGAEVVEPLPEAGRTDEIGQLARVFNETRESLLREREARQNAERMATLGKMATGLAHEINNPVSAIKLHTQLLQADPDSPDSLATILNESAKIESLVNQWMFLARPHPPTMADCDLGGIIGKCVRGVAPLASHCGVELVVDPGAGLHINGDQRRLSQAIWNLLVNAIHAAAPAGRKVWVTTRESGGDICVAVADSGKGFSATALEKGTELFYSEKEGGIGIGLSVTAEIVRTHGGRLVLENQPTGGARVSMVFPAIDACPTATQEPSSAKLLSA